MLASQYYLPTLREAPAEAEIPSHRLLLRGGFIRPLSAGVFSFLPLGLRSLRKIENIVREEMNAAGALEVFLPVLSPRDLWERSGRWDTFQPQPLRVQDRSERWFCLGPTHEEVITDLVAMDLESYRELPVTLYQIQTKFRDEVRARGGLIRVKEFLMKDAYSFGRSEEDLDEAYDAMYQAYVRIFERLELPTVIVRAEAGSMGGHDTREFMLLSENGEDTVFMCDSCDYASNAECAQIRPPQARSGDKLGERELVSTPEARTVEQVCEILGTTPEQLAKTLIYRADDRFFAVMVRGDRSLNEAKLSGLLKAEELRMANDEEVRELTGAEVGFAGPIGLPDEVTIIADHEIATMSDFVVGANQDDAHYVAVDVGADFQVAQFADLRSAVAGDACPVCNEGRLTQHRAIELAHVFKLGAKYSEDLGALFVDSDGTQKPAIMGCYGIGVSRCLAAIVEEHHDENGIIWPRAAAPFEVVVLLLDTKDEELRGAAEQVYRSLQEVGYDTMFDERDMSAGIKFAEADLIGYPARVVVGRKTKQEGEVEVRRRSDAEELVVPVAQAADAVQTLLGS